MRKLARFRPVMGLLVVLLFSSLAFARGGGGGLGCGYSSVLPRWR